MVGRPDARLTTNTTAALNPAGAIILVSTSGGVLPLFTGSMHVTGPLDILDSQPSATLTLLPGDVLKGVGSVNATIVNQGGTISPGDAPGTVFISASVSYGSASTYQVTIDGPLTSTGCVNPIGCAGTYSSTVVTGAGNTFTAGGTIAPVLRGPGLPSNYTPPVTTSFTVVQASGGVLGSFAGTGPALVPVLRGRLSTGEYLVWRAGAAGLGSAGRIRPCSGLGGAARAEMHRLRRPSPALTTRSRCLHSPRCNRRPAPHPHADLRRHRGDRARQRPARPCRPAGSALARTGERLLSPR